MESPRVVSVAAVAERLGVCGSTIRNWLRTGELERSEEGKGGKRGKRGVLLSSVERFERERIGRSRLVARANKSQKQSRAQSGVQSENRERYDESLGETKRNKDGVYYTPTGTIRAIYSIFKGADLSDKTLLDPCCGSGNFLIEALRMGFAPHNIYGYEIDPKAAQIARRRIYELTGVRSRNIKCGDFLESAQSIRRRFDYCVTNPPWGRKISRRERWAVTARYGARPSEDTSSIFLRAALCVVRDGGVVSFLVQEALFTVRAFEPIRRYLFNYEIINLTDHGRVFPSLITRAVSVTLRKAPATGAAIECQIIGNGNGNSDDCSDAVVMRSRESFACNPNLIYNIWANVEDVELIERLYKSKYITLSGKARWGLGVVTGNNQRYLSSSAKSGFEPVIGGADILPEAEGRWGVGQLRSESRYIDSDLTRYQQVAAINIYRAPEKLIYKFISNRLSFALDTTGCITLNSANILIPNSDFPLSARQLAALLNSEVMNRVYRVIFHANKVLRGDLERLPLLTKYFEQNEEFDEKRYERWLKVELGYNIT